MPTPISRKRGSFRRLLFLCTDNYLASRYCEELFNSRIRGEGLNWQGISRSFAGLPEPRPNEPMAPEAVLGLRQRGAAPVNHRRLPLAALPFDFETSQIGVALLRRPERSVLLKAWPDQAERLEIWTIADHDVPALFDELTRAVDALIDRLISDAAETLSPAADRGERGISAKLDRLFPTGPGSGDGRFDSLKTANP